MARGARPQLDALRLDLAARGARVRGRLPLPRLGRLLLRRGFAACPRAGALLWPCACRRRRRRRRSALLPGTAAAAAAAAARACLPQPSPRLLQPPLPSLQPGHVKHERHHGGALPGIGRRHVRVAHGALEGAAQGFGQLLGDYRVQLGAVLVHPQDREQRLRLK
jgi:hypothetical protein